MRCTDSSATSISKQQVVLILIYAAKTTANSSLSTIHGNYIFYKCSYTVYILSLLSCEANKSDGVSHWLRGQLAIGEAEFSKTCILIWGSGGMAPRNFLNFISFKIVFRLFQCAITDKIEQLLEVLQK